MTTKKIPSTKVVTKKVVAKKVISTKVVDKKPIISKVVPSKPLIKVIPNKVVLNKAVENPVRSLPSSPPVISKPSTKSHYQTFHMGSKSPRNLLWAKMQDDISDLPMGLQTILKWGFDSGKVSEDAIIFEIDDLEKKVKLLERFYELAEKLNIKIETLEELLEQERLKAQEECKTKLGKIQMYDTNYTINDKQYHDYIKLYFNELSKIPLLTTEEEKDLTSRIKRGDDEAKKKLIESNLRLVISVAKKFIHSRLGFLDLIQEGNIWLIKAIDKFDPDRDLKFSTYAHRRIKQNITKAIADLGKNVRIPVHLMDEMNQYNKAYQEIFQKTGKEPSSRDIAAKLNFHIKKIKKLEEVIFGNVSLDMTVGDDGKNTLWDLIQDPNMLRPDQVVENDIIKNNLDKILQMLDERESKIIKMRYGIDGPKYTLEQVGAEFDVTRERVRQIEQKVIQKLQEHIGLQRLIGIEDEVEKMGTKVYK